MAQLAIKGHATRGNEIIEILKMLGGKNKVYLQGTDTSLVYYIHSEDYICTLFESSSKHYKVFTLEKFLEKFPYKVGDKVIVKGYKQVFKILSMRWCSERNDVLHLAYNGWFYTEELQPYKEKTMEEKEKNDWAKWDLPEGYEFQDKEGNVINTDGIKLVKKQPQYPKTYEECAKVLLELASVRNDIGYKGDLIVTLQKLLVCRDAYWKIAGDWKFDFDKPCYYLCNEYGSINKFDGTIDCGTILTFPTKEVRDTFYENFKDLIEECKEFL